MRYMMALGYAVPKQVQFIVKFDFLGGLASEVRNLRWVTAYVSAITSSGPDGGDRRRVRAWHTLDRSV